MRVLMVTSEWPTPEHPEWVPFLVQQVRYLESAGVNVQVFPFRGAKNLLNYVKAWLKVRKILRGTKYDLIHAQFGQSCLVVLPTRLPLIVTFHGSDLQGDVDPTGNYTFLGAMLVFISKMVARWADEIIVVAPKLGQKLPKGLNPSHTIPCGLDLNLFCPIKQAVARSQLKLSQDKAIVLFGGRPEMPVKRYSLARAAIAKLERNDVELIALSNVPHNLMPFYMNASDVMLITSVHEGSPTMVKEALACNLPIVSTDVGDVRERIGSIEGCIVCDDDRPETIANALAKVLARGQRIDGRQAVMDLDERLLTQKVIQVYQKAIAKAISQNSY